MGGDTRATVSPMIGLERIRYSGTTPAIHMGRQVRYHHAMASRMVMCKKLQRELPGLETSPWPGELGQRVYDNISAEAWKLWEERMKMILNEYRLMPWQKEAQQLVGKHMEDFFFGEGAALPPGYVPPQGKQ